MPQPSKRNRALESRGRDFRAGTRTRGDAATRPESGLAGPEADRLAAPGSPGQHENSL